jgi:DNA-directed RNA polymerase beta subunit
MNIGQMYELYCGLIAKEIGKRILKLNNKEEIIALLSSVYSNLDGSSNSKMSIGMIASFKSMSDAKFKNMVTQIRNSGFSPIIIPPFQAPTKDSIGRVLKLLNLKSGYHMMLPEYGVKTASPIPFGYSYVGKLEHMAAEKMHGRSTGPITTKTFQPTAGKRAEGGQKVGEGDTWALASYNALTLLQEMFGPMSDDRRSKSEMITEIVETGHTEFRKTQVSPTRDLVNAYFMALMVEGK